MKVVDIDGHFKAPGDILLLKESFNIEGFKSAYFQFCFEKKIDQNEPKIEEVFPRGNTYMDHFLILLPDSTICSVDSIQTCWGVNEPFARQDGEFTRTISFYPVVEVARKRNLTPQFVGFCDRISSQFLGHFSPESRGGFGHS